MQTRVVLLAAAVIVLKAAEGLGGQAAGPSERRSDHLITATAMGPIALGMTLEDARRAAPSATFRRSSDGDGAALVEVILHGNESLVLWASEEDPGLPIDWTKPIRTIETFDRVFSTGDGIRVGTLVAAAERVWGPVREIVESEIESRQFVTFQRQPGAFALRIDYTGLFAAGARRTTHYRRGARILSIAISSE